MSPRRLPLPYLFCPPLLTCHACVHDIVPFACTCFHIPSFSLLSLLTHRYDILLPNVTGWETLENVMQHIFPTTPIELGSGFIVGVERIVTKVSRSFTWSGTQSELTLRVFDRQGFLTSKSTVRGPEIRVELDGDGARSFAVVSA